MRQLALPAGLAGERWSTDPYAPPTTAFGLVPPRTIGARAHVSPTPGTPRRRQTFYQRDNRAGTPGGSTGGRPARGAAAPRPPPDRRGPPHVTPNPALPGTRALVPPGRATPTTQRPSRFGYRPPAPRCPPVRDLAGTPPPPTRSATPVAAPTTTLVLAGGRGAGGGRGGGGGRAGGGRAEATPPPPPPPPDSPPPPRHSPVNTETPLASSPGTHAPPPTRGGRRHHRVPGAGGGGVGVSLSTQRTSARPPRWAHTVSPRGGWQASGENTTTPPPMHCPVARLAPQRPTATYALDPATTPWYP